MALGDTLSFGPFTFEPHTGRLTKRGHKIKLQPKAATALACLLEQPGAVVTRAQLQVRLWTEGTYVDFDLGIKVAIKKLRDALCDDSEEPVYIQTVHGAGYRFLAPVESTIAAESSRVSTAEAVPQLPVKLPIPIDRRTLWFSAMVGVVAIVLPAILIARAARTAPVNFQNRDWVVIAAFENRTGEKLLDGTMEFALERALGQSRYVNVAPRERINDALRLMRQSPSTVLNEELARQVAIRDGAIKAVLGGRVETFGVNYVLTVRLLEPARGNTIGVFERQATESHLPDAARSLSDELRSKLGEQANSVAADQPGLEKATTPSLAAYRAFSAGMKFVNERKHNQAAALLEEAVREDPQFASAHVYAAHSYSNQSLNDKAAPHYEAAFRLAPGVSQRERLFIQGSYYSRFLHDERRAVDAYQALVNLYPDDYWGTNNLLTAYTRLGMDRERIETAERLVTLRPYDPNYGQLDELWSYYRFDRPDKIKARRFGDQLRRLRNAGGPPPAGSWVLLDTRLDLEVASDRWVIGDIKVAAQELARVNNSAHNRSDTGYWNQVAAANLTLGKVSAAREICNAQTNPIARTECILRTAYVSGNSELGKELVLSLRKSGPSVPGAATQDLILFSQFGETTIPKTYMGSPP